MPQLAALAAMSASPHCRVYGLCLACELLQPGLDMSQAPTFPLSIASRPNLCATQDEGIRSTTRIAPSQCQTPAYTDSNANSIHRLAANPGAQLNTSMTDFQLDSTLICFVLVDAASRHAFCSRYDFGPWPLLQGIRTLPEEANTVRAWVFFGRLLLDKGARCVILLHSGLLAL